MAASMKAIGKVARMTKKLQSSGNAAKATREPWCLKSGLVADDLGRRGYYGLDPLAKLHERGPSVCGDGGEVVLHVGGCDEGNDAKLAAVMWSST
jgi:hypothetical protein